jgi:hypothetical protein
MEQSQLETFCSGRGGVKVMVKRTAPQWQFPSWVEDWGDSSVEDSGVSSVDAMVGDGYLFGS